MRGFRFGQAWVWCMDQQPRIVNSELLKVLHIQSWISDFREPFWWCRGLETWKIWLLSFNGTHFELSPREEECAWIQIFAGNGKDNNTDPNGFHIQIFLFILIWKVKESPLYSSSVHLIAWKQLMAPAWRHYEGSNLQLLQMPPPLDIPPTWHP